MPSLTGSEPHAEDLLIESNGPVLTVTFNRPTHHNAMTPLMYDGLLRACDRADEDDVRVLLLRSAGGRSFVSGTDISTFSGFTDSAGPVAFERRVSGVIRRLINVDVPVVAAIDGYCLGAGLAIAMTSDIRIASPAAQFGVPIARTLGNTLSAEVLDLALRHFGRSRTTDMILNARHFSADEMRSCGFVSEVHEDVSHAAAAVVQRILRHAPLTMWATKELIRRLQSTAESIDDEDVLSRVYGSADFSNGVRGFLTKKDHTWAGH
ncbi:enoyl-CoA hydratase [Rhodococcus sp. Chr-9]|uniref:enoyl-CoA hydratase n=2 Tax=Mycobacteriales TaxID=85007 RepID=UPI0005753F0F|nr:enoyl-CoA hydratase [Mycobacterium sp. MS1601]AQA07234.1 enoyl-CoA hydratase [Mycobacterium sp. MS1601]KHJ74051.1 enoyl-CoA hydratase [Rhodococcus sp. Chr-9]